VLAVTARSHWPTAWPIVAHGTPPWSNGQCLQACVASLLGADVSKVPDPQISYDADPDWHDHYNARLEKATGHRLDFLPASTCPPRNANQLWIAGLHEDEGGGHALLARGHFVIHDPAGIYRGNVPMDRLVDGMLVVPVKRLVPMFSLHGRGYRRSFPSITLFVPRMADGMSSRTCSPFCDRFHRLTHKAMRRQRITTPARGHS
jgi:hypothetical protein